MITTPTVFVLGAGASFDFGFPTGYDLLRAVVNFGVGTQGRSMMENFTGHSLDKLDEFRAALDHSADSSIDAFLEKRPTFMDVGKAAMAIELIAHENTHIVFSDPGGLNWMKYLFRRMQGSSFEEFSKNAVAFVTFNYDRVLEHFLCTALQSAWGQTEAIAGASLKHIPIIHLHGQLASLPWQAETNSRPFSTAIDAESLRVAAAGIKVVHEGVEDRKEQFESAKQHIKQAARTYFLGIGTSNVNFQRLGVEEFENDKAWATEKGLTDAEYREASQRYNPRILFQRHTDCRQMISNFVRWD